MDRKAGHGKPQGGLDLTGLEESGSDTPRMG
jgi:hypothetical protein